MFQGGMCPRLKKFWEYKFKRSLALRASLLNSKSLCPRCTHKLPSIYACNIYAYSIYAYRHLYLYAQKSSAEMREIMKKKNALQNIILRGLWGFPMGLAIGYTISIVSSLCYAGGYYAPCVPVLIDKVGSEIGAVVLQAILCGLIGTWSAATSVIWDMERLSLMAQTGIYFILNASVMMSVAYFCYWMEHSIKGFLEFFAVFALIFIVIWVTELLIGKCLVKRLNTNLYKIQDN